MANIITIDELYSILRTERIKGNGGKKILISTDDEGNGYHPLFFGVTPIDNNFGYSLFYGLPCGMAFKDIKKDFVILG